MPYQIHKSVAWQLVDGEVMIVNLTTGEAIGLNSSASDLWLSLAAGTADPVEAFAVKYGLTVKQACEDVGHFINQMLQENLLEETS